MSEAANSSKKGQVSFRNSVEMVHWPNPRAYICIHMFCLTLTLKVWLGIFANSFAAIGNQLTSAKLHLFEGPKFWTLLPTELQKPVSFWLIICT